MHKITLDGFYYNNANFLWKENYPGGIAALCGKTAAASSHYHQIVLSWIK